MRGSLISLGSCLYAAPDIHIKEKEKSLFQKVVTSKACKYAAGITAILLGGGSLWYLRNWRYHNKIIKKIPSEKKALQPLFYL